MAAKVAAVGEAQAGVAAPVERQLQRNLAGDALTGYDVNWGDDESTISCVHELHFKGVNKEAVQTAGAEQALPCTDVGFNSTGWVVAVAYGAVEQLLLLDEAGGYHVVLDQAQVPCFALPCLASLRLASPPCLA